ncbi:GntR family transcriptional regulator [Embleya sp. NPDC005575]|uniref:GntR family transcriptional regulator n=1 Tax=Embleya sp. NPDC005575 TaxID=3156892 RepID=UPI0033AE43AE
MQIAGHYRRQIDAGDLEPGQRLPSVRAIAEQFDVSRETAHKAVKLLRAEGLIDVSVGAGGAQVRTPKPGLVGGDLRRGRLLTVGVPGRKGEVTEGHRAELVPASADVADALGLEEGEQVIRRTRRFRDAAGVVAFSTSFLAGTLADVVPELMTAGPIPDGGTLRAVERATGRRAETATAPKLTAELLTEEAAAGLGMPAETAAVLVVAGRILDQDGEPIEFGIDIASPGRTWVPT